jgi:outer membrane protein assembly factor BamB
LTIHWKLNKGHQNEHFRPAPTAAKIRWKLVGQGLLSFLIVFASQARAGNWLTFGHDPQRTGWARGNDALSVKNVGTLELKWKSKLDNQPLSLTALTAPLVASGVTTPEGVKTLVYVAGSSDHVFALDADTGKLVWSVTFHSPVLPKNPGMWLCPNNLNATPTIDRRAGIIYVLAADGRLFGLGLGTGRIKFGPIQFVPPYSKDWSLNLIHGVIYTSVSQNCSETQSGIYAMDVRHPMRPVIHDLLVAKKGGAGIWGRGGVTAGEGNRIYAATGDGPNDPAAGEYGSSVIAVKIPALKVEDYYSPNDYALLTRYDLDIGASSPVWFAHGKYHLLAAGGKGGTLYLLNADRLGSGDHQTPLETLRLSNDQRAYEENGIWGGFATWRDPQGETWLYVPVWGAISKNAPQFPQTHGPDPDGCLMAFKVGYDAHSQPRLVPEWVSRDFNRPEPPVVANGVVFGLSTGENPQQTAGAAVVSKPGHFGNRILTNQERMENTRHAILYALDARTGKVLYSSGDTITSWVHFSGLAVANGRIYAVDHDSQVYCFDLKK